jgi:hypothetical protein
MQPVQEEPHLRMLPTRATYMGYLPRLTTQAHTLHVVSERFTVGREGSLWIPK